MSKKTLWAGRILSALPALFLLVDAIMKLVKPAPVVAATVALGYPESVILPLGIVLLICTALYVIPRTAVLGAILLTGYLGGAVATQVRIGSGAFPLRFSSTCLHQARLHVQPQFTDETAARMIASDDIFVMLAREPPSSTDLHGP